MKDKVEQVLDQVRPGLQSDGGDVQLVEVTEDGIVRVELQGSCKGCPFSQLTVKNFIEKALKEQIPEIKEVQAVN
ncbi:MULTISPECIES: NifU family protein [Vallitalea]|uniref:NifU family protein n=2 Tax=Vallitalea TaxID=1348611 RepID=A0A8J8SDH1_9FIRM|nr:NifU family protein [Vallitalea guaymasensis]QUH30802.1 NifU family protein [Vallitalea guaymasensis]GMQ65373.1 NifU family protein [Vallitalea sp. AN17-2]